MVEKSLIALPDIYLNQAFRLYNRLGFKLDQHHLNRAYPGPLHFLLEAQKQKQAGRKDVKTRYDEDTLDLIESIVPYTTEMGDGRWKSVQSFSQELVSSLHSNEKFDKFYVVHGAAGTGKSVYLATLFEAIKHEMCNNNRMNPLNEIKQFTLPLFHSNLKHISRYRELDAKLVLDGMGANLFPTQEIWSPSQLAELVQLPSTDIGLARGIILIDSLDEYITNTAKSTSLSYRDIRELLVETHSEFVRAGFVPVWSCRTREYHLLEMVEENQWNVKASTPPALDTTHIAEYCFCEAESSGILGEISKHSSSVKGMNSESSGLLEWLLKSASVNPLFFFFRTFTKNKNEAKKLMHSLIHRMQKAFEDVDQYGVLEEDSVMELQNQFVLSDFVVQTLLDHLYSTYTTERYNLKGQIQSVIKSLQHWVDNWGRARGENLEDLSEVFKHLKIEPSKVKEIVDFRVLEYYGLIAKTDENRWIWRHRSFAEYLCISDSSGLKTLGQRIVEIKMKWDEREFNRSVWKWRTWSGDFSSSRTIIRDRTGAYATYLNAEIFDLVPAYLDLFLDADDQIDGGRVQGEFGFSSTQFDIIRRGVQRNEAIVLKGWPGTGKTYTGTHMLLGRLVNAHLRSGRAEYDPELASKGLIITLNPKLSIYLKEELDQYENGPWSELAQSRIHWSDLKKSVEVLSMEEIVAELDEFGSSKALFRNNGLKDLKDIQKHWSTFIESCKHLRDWEYDPSYDWKKATREFQECFMDEMGDFHPSYEDVQPIFPGKPSKQWFEFVGTIFNDGSIPLQTACIKLVHRFIQAFDYYGEIDELPDTKLRPNDGRTKTEILDSLRTNPLVSDFSNALIDEVQDLPVEACLLISLLVHKGAGNQRSRVMFAGDEYQVLNQSNFKWGQFGRLYERKIDELKNRYHSSKIGSSSYLYQTEPPNVSDEPFTENWRNTPAIVDTWKRAGSWNPEKANVSPLSGIEKATCIRTQDDTSDHTVSLITYVESSPQSNPYEYLIDAADEAINNHSGVAFISMAPQLDNILRDKEVEHFTPFSIKGLERDNAVVVGSLLFDKDRAFSEDDINDERMRLIVGLSRAKNSMILLLPLKNKNETYKETNTVRISGAQYSQHSLEQLVGRRVQIISAEGLDEVRFQIEKIVGGDDEGRAILAIEEYLAAEAYGSDQINSIAERVRKICKKDIQEENQSSYFWQFLQQLNFSQGSEPTFLETCVLTSDSLMMLRSLDNIPIDGTDLSNTLSRFHRRWIKGEDDPCYKILQRYGLFNAFENTIMDMVNLSPPTIPGGNDRHNLTFNRIRSRIIDRLKSLRSDMKFDNFLWHEMGGLVRNSQNIALLHYLVKDCSDLSSMNQERDVGKKATDKKHAVALLMRIAKVSPNEYAKFRSHFSESLPELKNAIGAVLEHVQTEEKSVQDFLNDFPENEYKNILSTQALVRLIQFIIDGNNVQRRISFKRQLAHLFIAFCSPEHQAGSISTSTNQSSLSRKEFTLVYGLLGHRERQGVTSKNLKFDYAQHVLAKEFLDRGINGNLVEYSRRLDLLYAQSLSESTLMEPKLNVDERMPSEVLNPRRESKQAESLSMVVNQFIVDILDALNDPSDRQMFNQNGTIRDQLRAIAYTLLKYNADAYLRDIYLNQLTPDQQFITSITRLQKQKKIDLDEFIENLQDEIRVYLSRGDENAHQHLLVLWASVRYIIDVFSHKPQPDAMSQLREVSRMYPFLRLDDENERPLIAINDNGSYLRPPMDDFQRKTITLTREMKERRKNFTYFARSPFTRYRTTPRSHLSTSVYLMESMADWCKVRWEDYAAIANTTEGDGLGVYPVLIHMNSLELLPELLSKTREKALRLLLKAKQRVFVDTIVGDLRKLKAYRASVPFGYDMEAKINDAQKSEAYEKMLGKVETEVGDAIVIPDGSTPEMIKARELAFEARESLRTSLVQARSNDIILNELWSSVIKEILSDSFGLEINNDPDNKRLFIDVIKNEDAIAKLESGD